MYHDLQKVGCQQSFLIKTFTNIWVITCERVFLPHFEVGVEVEKLLVKVGEFSIVLI
jgi:hypothetical protein